MDTFGLWTKTHYFGVLGLASALFLQALYLCSIPLLGCVPDLAKPQFLYLQNGINGKSDFIRLHKDLFCLTSITEHLLYASHKAEKIISLMELMFCEASEKKPERPQKMPCVKKMHRKC